MSRGKEEEGRRDTYKLLWLLIKMRYVYTQEETLMKIKYDFLLSCAVDRFLEPSQILHLIRTTESVCTQCTVVSLPTSGVDFTTPPLTIIATLMYVSKTRMYQKKHF